MTEDESNKALLDLIGNNTLIDAPDEIRFARDAKWRICSIGIDNDHTAYILIAEDDLAALRSTQRIGFHEEESE